MMKQIKITMYCDEGKVVESLISLAEILTKHKMETGFYETHIFDATITTEE